MSVGGGFVSVWCSFVVVVSWWRAFVFCCGGAFFDGISLLLSGVWPAAGVGVLPFFFRVAAITTAHSWRAGKSSTWGVW